MHIKNTTEIKYRRQSAIHFKGRVPDFPQQRPAALFCRIPAFVVSSLFYIQISFTDILAGNITLHYNLIISCQSSSHNHQDNLCA